jgi:TonB family protein
MLLLLAAITVPVEGPKPMPINPQQWVTPADYPAAAIAARHQGTVSFSLDISADGRVTGCRITGSSSSPLLDSSTCGLIVRRGRFRPAVDGKGKAIASTYNGRFRWILPQPKIPPAGMLVTTVELTPEGKVENCATDYSGGAPVGAGAKICQSLELPFQAAFLKQHAAAFRRVRFATAVSVDERQFPLEDKGWGTLLIRSGMEVQLGKDGRPTRCTLGRFVGTKAIGDPCAPILRQISLSGVEQAPAHTVTFVNAVFGEPR